MSDQFKKFKTSDQFKKLTPKQKKAIKAWCNWYCAKLDRICNRDRKNKLHEGYSGYEQDLFEAFGCTIFDEDELNKD